MEWKYRMNTTIKGEVKNEDCQCCNCRKTKSRAIYMKESREMIMYRVKAGEVKGVKNIVMRRNRKD